MLSIEYRCTLSRLGTVHSSCICLQAQDTFADTLEEVTAHFVLATESLAESSALTGDPDDVLYSAEEAGTIVDTTTKVLKNAVVDNGGGVDAVANLFLLFCPELNTALSKAAGIVSTNRDLAKMALVFSEVHDEIQVVLRIVTQLKEAIA